MADFNTTYRNHIQPNEAYYVNNRNDPGGRTYGGIAQNIFPKWEGFTWLMSWISRNGEPRWNQQFKELDPLVTKFFTDLWYKNQFDKLRSQEIADIFFDWFVNTIKVYAQTGSSVPVKEVQKIIGVTADGVMGPKTVNAINAQNQDRLFDAIKSARKNFYERLVRQNASLAEFLPGWLSRLDKFTKSAALGLGGILLTAGLFFLGYKIYQNVRKNKNA